LVVVVATRTPLARQVSLALAAVEVEALKILVGLVTWVQMAARVPLS